jgi:hypothetical protein
MDPQALSISLLYFVTSSLIASHVLPRRSVNTIDILFYYNPMATETGMTGPKPDCEASAPPGAEDGSQGALAFHPSHITLSTFNRLLACYPRTVEQVHRNKLIQKLQSKQKSKPKRKSAETSTDALDTTPTQKTDLTSAEEKHIQDDLDTFLKLDRWRYETLPKKLAKRKGNEAHLTKDELVDIMAWKT